MSAKSDLTILKKSLTKEKYKIIHISQKMEKHNLMNPSTRKVGTHTKLSVVADENTMQKLRSQCLNKT